MSTLSNFKPMPRISLSNLKKIVAVCLLLLVGTYEGIAQKASSEQQKADVENAAEELSVVPMVDANYEIERTYKSFFKMDVLLRPDKGFEEIDSLFAMHRRKLIDEANGFHSFNSSSLSKYFLESSYRLWAGYYLKLGIWQVEVNKRVKDVQVHIDHLDKIIKRWELTVESKEYEMAPNNLRIRIIELIDKANDYRSKFYSLKRTFILMEDEITDQLAFINQILIEVDAYQKNQRDSLLIAHQPSLFHVHVDANDYKPFGGRLKRAFNESYNSVETYFVTQTFGIFIFVSLVFILIFVLVRKNYLRMDKDETEPGHKTIIRIFQGYPLLTVITMVLVFFHLLNPFYPLILNHLVTLLLLINMFFILKKFIDKTTRSFILHLVILLAINDLEVAIWYFGDVARFYTLFESLAGILLVYKFVTRTEWKDFSDKTYILKARALLAAFIMVFYNLALLSNVVGLYDLSVLLLSVGIHVPEFTVLLYGLYLIMVYLVFALIRIIRNRHSMSLFEKYARYERITDRTARTLGVVYWVFSLLVSFQVNRLAVKTFAEFLEEERNFGAITLTYGNVLLFFLILLLTLVITKVLRFGLEYLLKRSGLPRGVPLAIAATVGYLIVGGGFLIALATTGVDLSKFGFIAGALGVGIGFGLQNIVGNFISGLILLYERPLQLGDTIEVENLLGKVNRIGIRSSNVRTFDGSEVVVPNSNLVSNQLINWTLSDNTRRIEIKVGAAYGSDPNTVIRLLAQVAAENPNVLKEPEPLALFDGFGDSSLNFRLLFWTHYDLSLITRSAVAVAVYNIFKEHNIEIPFPQLDVHMKQIKQQDLLPSKDT